MFDIIADPMFTTHPNSLGFPSNVAQSSYYLGEERMSHNEIHQVSKLLERESICPENTRIQKVLEDGQVIYKVLQASVKTGSKPHELSGSIERIQVV